MEIISLLIGLIWANSTGYQMVSADSPFIMGNTVLNENIESFNAQQISFIDDCNVHSEEYKIRNAIFDNTCLKNCNLESSVLHGVSMTPIFKDESKLILSTGTQFDLKKGQTIIYNKTMEKTGIEYYWKENDWIIHQIVEFQNNDVVVLGLNNTVCELIPRNAIKGIVIGISD